MSRKIGECCVCHETRELVAKRMCSPCYQRQLRGAPAVDCFAVNIHARSGQCGVMVGNCIKQKGQTCPFYRSSEDYMRSRIRALTRIRNLPKTQRDYITQTYLTQKDGAE